MLPGPPALYLRVLPLVLRDRGLAEVRLARELEAGFHGAEEVRADLVGVLERGHDVGGAGQGLEQLDLLERIRHCITALETVAVSEQNLDTFVVISLCDPVK